MVADRHCGDCAWLAKGKDNKGLVTGRLICDGPAVNESLGVTYWNEADGCSGFAQKGEIATLTARLEKEQEHSQNLLKAFIEVQDQRDEAVELLARVNAAITYPDQKVAVQGRWALPAAVAIPIVGFLTKAQQRPVSPANEEGEKK